MAQRTIFVGFYYPSDVITILSCNTDDKVKKACFVVTKYNTPEEALYAYEISNADWSVIIDDDQDVNKFVDEAYDHLKSNDLNDRKWLYKHFV